VTGGKGYSVVASVVTPYTRQGAPDGFGSVVVSTRL